MTTLEEKYFNAIELLEKTLEILKLYVEANQKLETDFTALKNEFIQMSQIEREVSNNEDVAELATVRVALSEFIKEENIENLKLNLTMKYFPSLIKMLREIEAKLVTK